MDIGETLKNFVIDTWYRAFVCLGAVLFVLSLTVDVNGMSNGQLQLLSGGLFLIGMGVWKNVKIATLFKPPNVYTGPAALISTNIRQAGPVGLCFEILGGILLLSFLVAIMFGSSRNPPPVSQPPVLPAQKATAPGTGPSPSGSNSPVQPAV
jgi:hypothetical protein